MAKILFFPNGLDAPESSFIQESAGIGFKMSYQRGAFYPIDINTGHISDMCVVYHLANNYIGNRQPQGNFNIKKMSPLQNELL